MQKVMKVYFFCYSLTSKAFKVFNKRTLDVEESINVIFDKSNPPSNKDFLDGDDDISIRQENIDELFIFISQASGPFVSSFEFGPRPLFLFFLFIKVFVYYVSQLIVRVIFLSLNLVWSKCHVVSFHIASVFRIFSGVSFFN